MDKLPDKSKKINGIITSSVVIGISLVVCSLLIGSTITKVKGMGQTIRVTGAAFKPIVSDLAVWEGNISRSSPSLDEAYAGIKSDLEKVKAFMADNGFTESEYEIGTISIRKMYNREREISGYNLKQGIKIELDDVNRVTRLAKDASVLIEKGVEFDSRPPRYIFTGLEPLKLEMIRAATENAKMRAEQLAGSTDMEVGAPRSARVGVFQIRPLRSQAVSDYGINDQSAIEKEIVCTVHISFQIN